MKDFQSTVPLILDSFYLILSVILLVILSINPLINPLINPSRKSSLYFLSTFFHARLIHIKIFPHPSSGLMNEVDSIKIWIYP